MSDVGLEMVYAADAVVRRTEEGYLVEKDRTCEPGTVLRPDELPLWLEVRRGAKVVMLP